MDSSRPEIRIIPPPGFQRPRCRPRFLTFPGSNRPSVVQMRDAGVSSGDGLVDYRVTFTRAVIRWKAFTGLIDLLGVVNKLYVRLHKFTPGGYVVLGIAAFGGHVLEEVLQPILNCARQVRAGLEKIVNPAAITSGMTPMTPRGEPSVSLVCSLYACPRFPSIAVQPLGRGCYFQGVHACGGRPRTP